MYVDRLQFILHALLGLNREELINREHSYGDPEMLHMLGRMLHKLPRMFASVF